MGRMHAPGKGISQSALPYRRSVPQWMKMTSDEVKDQIFKLAKKGLTPSQIGVILRDSHGVAQVNDWTTHCGDQNLNPNSAIRTFTLKISLYLNIVYHIRIKHLYRIFVLRYKLLIFLNLCVIYLVNQDPANILIIIQIQVLNRHRNTDWYSKKIGFDLSV